MKSDVKPGKVALNQQMKLEAILNAAYELFITKGIENTTINDITQKAGIGKGTLYIYFDNKNEIAREIVNRQIRSFLSGFFDTVSASEITHFHDALIRMLDHLIDYIAEDPMKRKLIMNYIGQQITRPEIIVPEQAQYFKDLPDEYNNRRINNLIEGVLASACFFGSALLDRGMSPEEIKPRILHLANAILEEFA